MKIGILGAGNIGGTLGRKWMEAGHEVVFGVRDPGSPRWKTLQPASGRDVRPATVKGAISTGEVILFATPWAAVAEIARQNAAGLTGKIVIDATNNFGGPVINNLAAITQAAPGAKVFRAFNSLGWEIFEKPEFGATVSDLIYCGPDGQARGQVEALIQAAGLRSVWAGGPDQVHLVDNLGALWVNLAFRQGYGRSIAFKLLER